MQNVLKRKNVFLMKNVANIFINHPQRSPIVGRIFLLDLKKNQNRMFYIILALKKSYKKKPFFVDVR